MNHINIATCFAYAGSDPLHQIKDELNNLSVRDDVRGDEWESWYQEQQLSGGTCKCHLPYMYKFL